jgi:hypothetical protein
LGHKGSILGLQNPNFSLKAQLELFFKTFLKINEIRTKSG